MKRGKKVNRREGVDGGRKRKGRREGVMGIEITLKE